MKTQIRVLLAVLIPIVMMAMIVRTVVAMQCWVVSIPTIQRRVMITMPVQAMTLVRLARAREEQRSLAVITMVVPRTPAIQDLDVCMPTTAMRAVMAMRAPVVIFARMVRVRLVRR